MRRKRQMSKEAIARAALRRAATIKRKEEEEQVQARARRLADLAYLREYGNRRYDVIVAA